MFGLPLSELERVGAAVRMDEVFTPLLHAVPASPKSVPLSTCSASFTQVPPFTPSVVSMYSSCFTLPFGRSYTSCLYPIHTLCGMPPVPDHCVLVMIATDAGCDVSFSKS